MLDTVFAREETGTEIIYTIHESEIKTLLTSPAPVKTYTYSVRTMAIAKGYSGMIDTTRMPEETNVGGISYYAPTDNTLCHSGHWYKGTSGTLFNDFEPCGTTRAYKLGMGMVYEHLCHDPTPGPSSSESTQLIYCVKNGTACGTYVPVVVSEVAANAPGLSLYPNPADNVLNLSLPHSGNYSFSLASIAGREC